LTPGDGFKRLDVLRALAQDQVAVRVVHIDEAAAQAALITYNTPHRGLCELEEAWVVRSLVRKCGLLQKDIAELLGRHKSWVCRRLRLAERLIEPLQQDMRLGLVRASTARELARLPAGNQARAAEAARAHGLTARQTARLVELLLTTDPNSHDALLADPGRFVGPESTSPVRPTKDPRLSVPAEALRQALLRLGDASRAVQHSISRHPIMSMSDEEADVLQEVATPVVDVTAAALRNARLLARELP